MSHEVVHRTAPLGPPRPGSGPKLSVTYHHPWMMPMSASVYSSRAIVKPKKFATKNEATRNWLNEICTKYRPEGYIRSEVRG